MDLGIGFEMSTKITPIVVNPEEFVQISHHNNLKIVITTMYRGDTWMNIRLMETLRIKIEQRVTYLNFMKIYYYLIDRLHERKKSLKP
jgi:hypothetical protein